LKYYRIDTDYTEICRYATETHVNTPILYASYRLPDYVYAELVLDSCALPDCYKVVHQVTI